MNKIFITGATGFVGGHLVDYLSQNKDNKLFGTTFNDAKQDSRIELEKINLLDSKATKRLVTNISPTHVYHLAALTSPRSSFQNPTETITNNINAEVNLLEACRELNGAQILIISSAEVYGDVEKNDLPINENTPLRPVNPYAVSKIAQDYLALQYHLAYGLNTYRVRPFNHTGPRQAPMFVVPAFAKQIAEIEQGLKEPVIKVGNLDSIRDFTDVRDMVKAYELTMLKGRVGEVYNLGSDKSFKISYILDALIKMAKVEIKIENDSSKLKPSDIPELTCDSSKFRKLTGWEPKIKIETTLKDVLDYWRQEVSGQAR